VEKLAENWQNSQKMPKQALSSSCATSETKNGRNVEFGSNVALIVAKILARNRQTVKMPISFLLAWWRYSAGGFSICCGALRTL